MGILNGNNSLLSGTYKYSLSEYMNVFKLDQTNPMISLMLGITFVHMACQKFSARKQYMQYLGGNLKWISAISNDIVTKHYIKELYRNGGLRTLCTVFHEICWLIAS